MEKRRFAGAHGEVLIDLCWDCHALWFDRLESAQLAPAAVIELFRLIHDHRDRPARPLAERMACPECATPLAFTHDLQRTNRINYYRCPQSHGRLTTFLQFLREKQFVRSLSSAEIDRLRAAVKQVRCSGCGAPVDVAKDAACGFCRAPLSILDPDAVNEALARWQAAASTAGRSSPAAPASAGQPDADAVLQALLASGKEDPQRAAWRLGTTPVNSTRELVDLVAEGLHALFSR
jgi:hypothetical protein